MKQKRTLLIGIILSIIVGWVLGFLRLPYVEKNASFLLGFIAGLAAFSLVLLFLFVWKKNSLLVRWLGEKPMAADAVNPTKTYTMIGVLVALFIVLGGLVSSFLLFKQNAFSKNQAQQQRQVIAEQSALMASTRKSNLLVLMNTLFDKVDKELKNTPERTLSNETIERIAALNYAFKPYRYMEGDSLSAQKLSPERGQLLLVLTKMDIAPSTFEKIKQKTAFSEADLRGANLEGADLRGVNLSEANLSDANLKGANINHANLSKANFWGANLEGADFRSTNLKRVDFRWANLNHANLQEANLDGVNMSNAKLRKADLSDVKMQWAELSGAMFNEANLERVDFFGSNLSKVNLSEANLTDANLRRLNMSEVNLSGAELDKATIEEKDWLKKLEEWQVAGAKKIQERYKMIDDTTGRTKYQLIKTKE